MHPGVILSPWPKGHVLKLRGVVGIFVYWAALAIFVAAVAIRIGINMIPLAMASMMASIYVFRIDIGIVGTIGAVSWTIGSGMKMTHNVCFFAYSIMVIGS
jgi:hypothetical protein